MEEGRSKRITEKWVDILMGFELPSLGTSSADYTTMVFYHLQLKTS